MRDVGDEDGGPARHRLLAEVPSGEPDPLAGLRPGARWRRPAAGVPLQAADQRITFYHVDEEVVSELRHEYLARLQQRGV